MTTTVKPLPTEPEQFDHAKVRAELAAITALLPQLELYSDREFRELPEQLQQRIRALVSITQPTTGGLERVESLLWQMGTVSDLLDTINQGQSIQLKLHNLTEAPSELGRLYDPGADSAVASAPPSSKQSASVATSEVIAEAAGTLQLPTVDPTADDLSTAPRRTISESTVLDPTDSSGGTLVLPTDSD